MNLIQIIQVQKKPWSNRLEAMLFWHNFEMSFMSVGDLAKDDAGSGKQAVKCRRQEVQRGGFILVPVRCLRPSPGDPREGRRGPRRSPPRRPPGAPPDGRWGSARPAEMQRAIDDENARPNLPAPLQLPVQQKYLKSPKYNTRTSSSDKIHRIAGFTFGVHLMIHEVESLHTHK